MPIFDSHFPDVVIPGLDVWHMVTSNPNNVPEDKTALIDAQTGRSLTRGQVFSLAKRIGYGLVNQAGLKRGGVVGVFSINQIEFPSILFGVLAAGGRVSPINPAFTPKELVHQIQLSGASILILHPSVKDVARQALGQLSQVKKVYVLADRPINGWQPLTSIITREEIEPCRYTAEEAATETAYLCFSAGTTGLNKGVETTHRNIIANMMQVTAYDPDTYNKNEIFVGVLPFYHIYGLTLLNHVVTYVGATLVIIPKFELNVFCQAIQTYKITVAHVVPPMALLLAKSPMVGDYDLSSIKVLTSGAAPLSKNLAVEVNKRLGCYVLEGYGMTELSPVSHLLLSKDSKMGSVGFLLPNLKAKIVNEEGKELGINEPGELWLSGPNVMKGYLKNPVATRETIDQDGFLHTGDIAYVDEKGYFFIIDRLKELIKYKGFQVPPADLEALLLTHPQVLDCAVIGVYSDEDATELPRAYVVLKDKQEEKRLCNEIEEFVASKVANHKKLRGGVCSIDVIPKSTAGKILRRILREKAKDEVKEEHRFLHHERQSKL